jgi:hypothetical protein
MNERTNQQTLEADTESTGLVWPRTWNGAYFLVVASFIFWLALLIALMELCR